MSDLKQQHKQNARIQKECETQRNGIKNQREAMKVQQKQQADADKRKRDKAAEDFHH